MEARVSEQNLCCAKKEKKGMENHQGPTTKHIQYIHTAPEDVDHRPPADLPIESTEKPDFW